MCLALVKRYWCWRASVAPVVKMADKCRFSLETSADLLRAEASQVSQSSRRACGMYACRKPSSIF
jgi:hypothetical protein